MNKEKGNINVPLIDWAVLDGKLVSIKINEEKVPNEKNPKNGIFLIKTPRLPKI